MSRNGQHMLDIILPISLQHLSKVTLTQKIRSNRSVGGNSPRPDLCPTKAPSQGNGLEREVEIPLPRPILLPLSPPIPTDSAFIPTPLYLNAGDELSSLKFVIKATYISGSQTL